MKVCVIQPPYSLEWDKLNENLEKTISMMDECDESLDLIVLPEYSEVPAVKRSIPDFLEALDKNAPIILEHAAKTAARCHAIVFVNVNDVTPTGRRNTTFAFDREGRIVGKYYKEHPAPSEVRTQDKGGYGLDVAYTYEPHAPYVLELEGLRFGFLTCYDFYFYESFAQLARQNLDVIIGCSHQRTDTHEALSIINRFLCYQTNAYLIRASVSLGEDSPICGCSTVITPDGRELVNLKSRVGFGITEIDPHAKYYKPAGFGGAKKAHYEYIEEGRRPWLYRNGGASIVPFDDVMPYPRICAHRGFSTVAPENTLPALASAVSLGAQEIEFDVWSTKDGVLVSAHDETLERVSNGHGRIGDHTYDELKKLDFGSHHDARFEGLRIPTFEEILQKLGGHAIMNIHVKIWDAEREKDYMEKIVGLIRKYDCAKHIYFMTTSDRMIKKVQAYAPEMRCCVGWDGNKTDPLSMAKRAIALGAYKIQLFKPYFNQETVDLAHAHGILCNVFWSDDPEEAKAFRAMGIDTVLTNDYLRIKNALEEA